MIPLLLVYWLCLLSGYLFERRFPLNQLLPRVLLVFSFAAVQLILTIQVLSLFYQLTGMGLIVANALFTTLVFTLARVAPPSTERRGWKQLLVSALDELRIGPKNWPVLLLPSLAVLSVVIHCCLGLLVVPSGDVYHFEMPLYWRQNHSINPFPVNNPRIVSLSFLAEGLALPGYLYTNSAIGFFLLTLFAALATLAVVYSLARRLGCSIAAAVAAASMVAAFTDFGSTLLTLRAGTYLAGLWTGASMLFLLDSRPLGNLSKAQQTTLGCSIFCFVLACAAKNSITLLAPVYLLCLAIVFKKALLKRRVFLLLALSGGLAFVCSGMAWNYLQNKLWFGDFRGARLTQVCMSREFRPGAVWTRLSRGGVLLLFDTLWVPRSARAAYTQAVQKAAHALGAQPQLKEDDQGYFSFNDQAVGPLKGAGLVGIALLLPGLGVALWGCLRPAHLTATQAAPDRIPSLLLLLMTVGSFAMCHLMFRWQSIGVLRLMPAFAVIGAPLCAPLLERAWSRAVALALLLVSSALFLALDLSMVGRRVGAAQESKVFKTIYRFARPHAVSVTYQWRDQPPMELQVREDYSNREIILTLLAGLPQPCTIGFIGYENSPSYFLFGPHLANRIIPLYDARNPERILEPPQDQTCLVIENCDSEKRDWALKRGFRPLFESSGSDSTPLAAFERKSLATASMGATLSSTPTQTHPVR